MSALFHPDTLFSPEGTQAGLERELYASICSLPLVCPHGHTDPAWFANNQPFEDPASLLVMPDHYLLRMFTSQGLKLEDFGIPTRDGAPVETDRRVIWKLFAQNYHLFRCTPSRLWLDYTFSNLFSLDKPLCEATADFYYDQISECLARPEFRPRALYDSFNIEVIATTESALDELHHHRTIQGSDWQGRVVTTYRPDQITDPENPDFIEGLDQFASLTGQDTSNWQGYLEAHRMRRAYFREYGATATDHGVPTPLTANLNLQDAESLYDRVRSASISTQDAALFRAQMLTEMAKMSVEDGMIMQIHPGSYRNHSGAIFERFGRDIGFDIPKRVDFVNDLRPLLECVGHSEGLNIILFTLDESTYARELAPLAGAYPCLKLGPAWWFNDSPEGMMRMRDMCTETAGLYNTVGFNDDTRAFPSIPARHDIARRVDCSWLACQVTEHRLREDEAFELIVEFSGNLARRAYKFVE
jgi:glucuronate isomerase